MNIIYFLVPSALLMGLLFLVFFIWCSRSGQFDDLDTPPIRILLDEESVRGKVESTDSTEEQVNGNRTKR